MQIHFLLKCNECTFFHFIQMCILYIMLLITLLISEIRNVIHMQCMITYVINSNYLLFVYLEESAIHGIMSTMKAKQNKKKIRFLENNLDFSTRPCSACVLCTVVIHKIDRICTWELRWPFTKKCPPSYAFFLSQLIHSKSILAGNANITHIHTPKI